MLNFCTFFCWWFHYTKCSAEVLTSVPTCKEAVMCLREEMYMLGKFHSAVSYSAVDCDFQVSNAAVYIK